MALKNKKNEKENKIVKKDDKKTDVVKKEEKSKKAEQLTFDPPSDKLIHQILPFVFVVIAILLEACFVLASVTADQYVGIAGVFLKNVFLGLFGFCAFIIPLMLINLALNWRKFVDSHNVLSKIIFSVLFLISLSGLIHIAVKPSINPDTSVFIFPLELFEFSYSNIASSGIIGGFICECIYALFKSIGTMIIMAALTIIFFIFSLGMTPRNMGIYIRYGFLWCIHK